MSDCNPTNVASCWLHLVHIIVVYYASQKNTHIHLNYIEDSRTASKIDHNLVFQFCLVCWGNFLWQLISDFRGFFLCPTFLSVGQGLLKLLPSPDSGPACPPGADPTRHAWIPRRSRFATPQSCETSPPVPVSHQKQLAMISMSSASKGPRGTPRKTQGIYQGLGVERSRAWSSGKTITTLQLSVLFQLNTSKYIKMTFYTKMCILREQASYFIIFDISISKFLWTVPLPHSFVFFGPMLSEPRGNWAARQNQ